MHTTANALEKMGKLTLVVVIVAAIMTLLLFSTPPSSAASATTQSADAVKSTGRISASGHSKKILGISTDDGKNDRKAGGWFPSLRHRSGGDHYFETTQDIIATKTKEEKEEGKVRQGRVFPYLWRRRQSSPDSPSSNKSKPRKDNRKKEGTKNKPAVVDKNENEKKKDNRNEKHKMHY